MKWKAVLFDLDDTLVVDEGATRLAFEKVARESVKEGAEEKLFLRAVVRLAEKLWVQSKYYEFCQSIGINDAECLWGDFGAGGDRFQELGEWAQGYRLEVFDAALREQMIENGDAARLVECFGKVRRQEQKLFPDALEILTRLKKVCKLGMLTNGAPSVQREKVRVSGIGPFFDEILVSGEEGIGKPDPRIFFILLERLGLGAGDVVMVGNSKTRDIGGAVAAGTASVWLQVPGAEEPADFEPTYTIRSLGELPAVLGLA